MTPQRFRQVRNVFDALLKREPASRTAFLEEACHGDQELRSEVQRLAAAHEQGPGWLEQGATAPAPPRLEGRNIGPYEILRELGQGGMGTVYLAARADAVFRKLVAIKIVRPEAANADILRRFQQEREILASLDHPNIARILDGGATEEGSPYLVMEYVDGKRIDAYCDEHRLNLDERLRLCEAVFAAIRYAHEQHVVHRDLKPGNILVTADGTVKVLDFGIAKLLPSPEEATALLTQSNMLAMTPEYASPEQIRGETVTAMSDVYSLGVLSYELLTGRRPYHLRGRIFHEIARVICEEPPTRPSTAVTERGPAAEQTTAPEALSWSRGGSPEELRRQLTGDLDGILLKSLEKDPLRRYASVAEFGEDVRRHLDGEPVRAKRNIALHAAGTFLRRHVWWILGFAAVAMALAGGVIVISRRVQILVLLSLAGYAGGYWLASRELGSLIVRRRLAFFGKLQAAFLLISAALIMLPRRGVLFNSLAGFALASVACCWYFMLRWPLRARRLGPLVLDASHRRPWFVGITVLSTVANTIPAIMVWRETGAVAPISIIAAVVSATLFAFSLLAGRVEIRTRGLACRGSLISWSEIVSYRWETNPDKFEILRLRRSGLWRSCPGGIPVPPELRSQLESALVRQLVEWPGRS